MALVRRAHDLIRSCFVWESGNNDDTQQIVNDRVPPLDGTDMPDSGVVSNVPTKTSDNSLDMNNVHIRMLVKMNERLQQTNENLQQTNERLQQTNENLQQTNNRLEAELTAVKALLEKNQSQIESLRMGQMYFYQEYDRHHNVIYSPTYRFESQEAIPDLSV